MTTTLLSSMGSRVVLPDTGVLMNNGIMWFDPRPGTANALQPARARSATCAPWIAMPASGSGARYAAAPPWPRILASVYQMLAWTLDAGMDVETAAHVPRIDVSGPDETTPIAAFPRTRSRPCRARAPSSSRSTRLCRSTSPVRTSSRWTEPARKA